MSHFVSLIINFLDFRRLIMNQLKQQIEVTLERLDQYAHREDFDLYDFEEIIFKEFQEVQKTTLSILTNKNLSFKKKL